jgi:RNA polymerase sigma-70 factor (ECF subfamily)
LQLELADLETPHAAPVPLPATDLWLRQHAGALFRYLRMLGAPVAVAEDLTQEAFLVVWRRGKQRLETAALATFLRRTARNLWLQQRRSDRRLEQAVAAAAERLWQRDCERDGGEAWIAATRECLQAMRGRARQAIELVYGDGIDRAGAAAALGLQPNGLKTLLQRSRQWLHGCIGRRLS